MDSESCGLTYLTVHFNIYFVILFVSYFVVGFFFFVHHSAPTTHNTVAPKITVLSAFGGMPREIVVSS